jgi:hypothetical protein
MTRRGLRRSQGLRGTTVVEFAVTAALTALFIYVVSITWISFERAGVDVIARCNLAREAEIAFIRLADDLRGAAVTKPNRLTITNINANEIWLNFIDDSITVKYFAQNGQLVREVAPSSNPPETVAWSVQGLSARQVTAGGTLWEIQLALGTSMIENRSLGQTLTRIYTFVTVIP